MANYVFPKVDLPKVGKSNFSLDKSLFTSFAPGTARVVYAKDVLPGDKFTIDFSAAIESMPMLSPMYGRWKARWAFFFEPYSNIYGWMDNNTRRSTEAIIKSKLLTYILPLGSFFTDQGDYNSDVYSPFFFDENLECNITFKQWLTRTKVATGSVFNDLGWPIDFSGYVVDFTSEYIDSIYLDNFQWLSPQGANLEPSLNNALVSATNSGRLNPAGIPSEVSIKNQPLHAVKALAYLDIIRNYYVNNQEGSVPFVALNTDTFSTNNNVLRVELDALDYIFMHIRSISPESYTIENKLSDYFVTPLNGYTNEFTKAKRFLIDWERSFAVPNGGNFLVPYSMDLNRGLIGVDTDNFQSFMTTDEQGRISVTQMYMQNKLQELINILDVTRGRFTDWLNGLWSVNIKGDIDRPVYLGSQTTFIKTKDIVSPSTTSGSVAGQQTGFSVGATNLAKKIHFSSDQYGCLMCVFTMIPEVSYSNGFHREDLKTTFMDIYNPRMSQIGYQDVPSKVLQSSLPTSIDYSTRFRGSEFDVGLFIANYQYNPDDWFDPASVPYAKVNEWPTIFTGDTIVGRQVAWAEYMSDIDETRGLFALGQSLEYWALTRRYFRMRNDVNVYAADEDLVLVEDINRSYEDYSTYVLPSEWNTLFADTAPDAENFRLWMNFDIFAKRAIPSRTLPHI